MDDQNTTTTANPAGEFDALDFGNKPASGFRDNDTHVDNMMAVHENTPNDVYANAHAAMQEANEQLIPMVSSSAILLENDRVFNEVTKLDKDQPAPDAIEEAHRLAIQSAKVEFADTQLSSSPEAHRETPGVEGNGKPVSLENTLASIRHSAEREQRFVIDGDPKIQPAFYAELEVRGLLKYQGGVPVINASHKKAAAILSEVCEREKVTMQPALSLAFDRTGDGKLSQAYAGIKNFFGKNHTVDVYLVGDQATIDKKLVEMGSLLNKMDKAGYIHDAQKHQVEDGKLVLTDGKPAHYLSNRSMQELTTMARNTVTDHQSGIQAKETERTEFRNAEQDEKIARAKEKNGTPASVDATGVQKPATASPYVTDIQSGLHRAVNSINGLHDNALDKDGNPTKQIVAVKLLNQVRTLNGKDDAEIAKLPTPDRQQMLTELAVVLAKADSGAFGKAITSTGLDKAHEADAERNKPATPSIRDKVAELVSAEKGREPGFESNSLQLLANMEKAGTVTRPQAEKAAEFISPGRELPPASVEVFSPTSSDPAKPQASTSDVPASAATLERTSEATKDRTSDATSVNKESNVDASKDAASASAKDSEKVAGNPPSTEKTTLTPETAKADTSLETKAELKSPEPTSKESVTAPVAQAADASKNMSEASSTKPAEQSSPVATATPDQTKAAASATQESTAAKLSEHATEQSKPVAPSSPAQNATLADKLDAIVKAGPDALTREDASALLATLDGRQTAKLSSLDGRAGDAPTQTVVRIEGLLAEVSKGKLGDDLAATAKDLGDSLDKWKSQDTARVQKGDSGASVDMHATVDKFRAADAAWHGGAANVKTGSAEQPGSATPAKGSEVPAASVRDAGEVERIAAAARYTQTEVAAGTLQKMMVNPPGQLLNRDKTWNEANVATAADAVLRVDVNAMKQMSEDKRTQVAMHASWMADNANNGKLPGFADAAGKERAAALTERAVQLSEGLKAEPSPALTKQMDRANAMVDEMAVRSRGNSIGNAPRGASPRGTKAASGSTRNTPASTSRSAPADVNRFAKDVGDSVFKTGQLTSSRAQYMLNNADSLTTAGMSTLSNKEKAEAVVGMAHLASAVRKGEMGDFKELPADVQTMVAKAEQTANALHTELSGKPGMSVALAGAEKALAMKVDGAGADSVLSSGKASPEASAAKAPATSTKPPSTTPPGRGLER